MGAAAAASLSFAAGHWAGRGGGVTNSDACGARPCPASLVARTLLHPRAAFGRADSVPPVLSHTVRLCFLGCQR